MKNHHTLFSQISLVLLLCLSSLSIANAGNTISAGSNHVCAIQEVDNAVICWGDNEFNQSASPGGAFMEVAAGSNFNCGLTTAGDINCWGEDTKGETSPPAGKFIQIAVGSHHACALNSTGEPICWGDNSSGQVAYPSGPFKQLALGNKHSCGLKSDGSVECWGSSSHGQSNENAQTFSSISAGYDTTCGIKTDGVATCWGRETNSYGFLTQIEFALSGDSDGTGHQTTKEYLLCGLKVNNNVSCPAMDSVQHGVFSYVTAGGHVTRDCHRYCSISSRQHHNVFHGFACGIRGNGIVSCWGENNKDRATAPIDVKIKQPTGFTVPQVSCDGGVVINQDLSFSLKKAQYTTDDSSSSLSADFSFAGENAQGNMLWKLDKYSMEE